MAQDPHKGAGRYAILVTGNLAAPLAEKYGNYGDMFIKLLKGGHDETWDVYFVFEKDSPADDVLANYECLVLTGSSADSFKDPEWNQQLKARLASAVRRQQRILGICYGHQVMARVLGGETGRASLFEGGPRTINVTPAFFDQWFVKPTWSSRDRPESWKFNVHETHTDIVTSMPPDATVIASSDKAHCEVMVFKDHFLGLQGHPEFTAEFQGALIDYRLQHGTLTDEQAQESNKALHDNPVTETDFLKVQKMLKYFVKGH
ncbi:hypothetical protein ABBQ32_010354 [Trebouxia sp. C0010 RCD-2024]